MREVPYSAEAERGVLGSILLDASRVMDLCVEQQLIAESFYVPSHRVVFDVMQAVMAAGSMVDPLTLLEALRQRDQLEITGGPLFLERLVDETPTAAHAEYYIDIVRQQHLLRAIIETAQSAEKRCYEEHQSADVLLGQVEQAFLDITERQHGVMQPWDQAIRASVTRIDRILTLGPGAASGLSSGFRNLDKITQGLREAEMIVLAARPSMGKTSLAMNVCENVALGLGTDKVAHPVGIFSLEMSQEALALRMLCAHAGVPSSQINAGMASPRKTNQQLTRAASKLSKAPIYVDDTGGLDVLELRARARRMKKKYGVELIMVDYLQLLQSREYARQGRQLETSHISSNLKAMAKELDLPVIVLSQLSRAPEQRDKTGKPKLSDLRDSGAIEQDADVVLLLRRPCRYPGDMEAEDETLAIVDVAKQRNGPTGEVRLNFEESLTRFSDRAEGVEDRFDHLDPEPGGMGNDAPMEDS